MARKLFNGIDGDLRVKDDTIIVTFYNAPEANTLKEHYIDLLQKLETEGTKHSRDLNPIPFWCVWRPMASLTALETAGMNNNGEALKYFRVQGAGGILPTC